MNPPKMKKTFHENTFTRLSEDSISEILSRTSPLDASRFAVVSKEFKSAADSDKVWERFVPMEIVLRSVSPLIYGSKKELYLNISPILLDDGNLSFSLTRETGKICFTVGAKYLIILDGNNSKYWEWTSHGASRFSEVGKLKSAHRIHISGNIKTDMLSGKTRYKAYLIFKLRIGYSDPFLGNALVRCANFDVYQKIGTRCCLPWLPGGEAVQRDDGWMEISLGEFYNSWEDDSEVQASILKLMFITENPGLILEGIEFRPLASKL